MTTPDFIEILRNNVIWLVVATGGSVLLGLVIAGLFDRVRREALAKTFVFLPLAISLIGASVIWGFMYAWQPAGQPQIGLLNAVVVGLGGQPIPWLHDRTRSTSSAEIVIMIWLQTGFAMVVLSAAIKGVSTEIIEAARLDGATERQLFFRVIVPMIRGSIITVSTTIAIVTLKIFDIVYVTTGGRFGDDVVAEPDVPRDVPVLRRRPRGGARDTAVHRRPARDVHQPAQLQTTAGGSMTAPAQPIASAGRTRPRLAAALLRSLPLRLAVFAICLLWTIPTLGLLVTSVRNPELIKTSGWWTALLQPVRSQPVDAVELPAGPRQRRHGQRVHQQPDRDHPVDGHPDHDRRVRRVRLRVDPVPRPRHPVHDRGRRCWSCPSRCR